jgi:hypothetical protein
MTCRKQPRFLAQKQIQITNILEVRLAPKQWNKIKIASWQRNRTYSTITRYCVLRLARKCSLRWSGKLHETIGEVQRGLAVAKDMHCHMMCLYGEDEKLIRLAAIELGLTLTAFVRLAIELYLRTLAMEKHSKNFVSGQDLKWEGIRLTQEIQIFAANVGGWPLLRDLSCIPFDMESYW